LVRQIENEEAINANNFAIALADVTAENFITRAHARAYDITTLPGAEIAVRVSTELPTTVGTANVTFTTEKGTTITVQAEVFNTVSDENKEAINANSFAVALSDVTAENFVTRANAKAYDITTLPGVEIGVRVASDLPTTIGMADVTFATDKGTTKRSMRTTSRLPSQTSVQKTSLHVVMRRHMILRHCQEQKSQCVLPQSYRQQSVRQT
jgi:hypothetical protein